MAAIKSIYKNTCGISRSANCELVGRGIRSLRLDISIPVPARGSYYYKSLRYGRRYSFTSIRNRCLFTGRARAVIKRVHLGRHLYKKLSSGGSLAGITKGTW